MPTISGSIRNDNSAAVTNLTMSVSGFGSSITTAPPSTINSAGTGNFAVDVPSGTPTFNISYAIGAQIFTYQGELNPTGGGPSGGGPSYVMFVDKNGDLWELKKLT